MTDILLSAFLLSVVLLGIHSFFGIEVIKRGIIFTDLAIGQMAAVGAAVSLLFLDGEYLDIISLTFALAGGGIIAVAAKRTDTHEAFIGLLYAFGLSFVFILLSKSAHGMETFQKLMASDILFTPLSEIGIAAGAYAVLGAILLLFYKKANGLVREALVFISFVITVTIAVRLAGVLIVFALLVAPALIALKIKWGIPIINAWIIGTVINLASILASYNFDFPTGYTLVFFHASAALIITLAVGRRKERSAAGHPRPSTDGTPSDPASQTSPGG